MSSIFFVWVKYLFWVFYCFLILWKCLLCILFYEWFFGYDKCEGGCMFYENYV